MNMTILLQTNKTTFEKSENLEEEKKIDRSQNLAEILTENCCCFCMKSFFMVFLKLPWRK